jgi:class 3 adenylate cyclase
MNNERAQDDRPLGRMDFVQEVLSSDDATRTIEVRLTPDPRRYTEIERDGEKYYLDKYLDLAISFEDMQRHLVQQMPGLPIYSLSPSIESTRQYATARRAALMSEFQTGEHMAPSEGALPHRRFQDNLTPRSVPFLSIDICGGSALRSTNPRGFDQAYRIFLRELGTVVGQFNGAVFKPTGDGFIALIDHPSFTSQCDNAVDLGLSLLRVLRESINPALDSIGMPALSVRIGADFGLAKIQELQIPATGFSQTDVASDALNRAVKIEQSCQPNEFRIGRKLYELVHVGWLERATEVDFDAATVGVPGYKVYRLQ